MRSSRLYPSGVAKDDLIPHYSSLPANRSLSTSPHFSTELQAHLRAGVLPAALLQLRGVQAIWTLSPRSQLRFVVVQVPGFAQDLRLPPRRLGIAKAAARSCFVAEGTAYPATRSGPNHGTASCWTAC
jgi:hypothetical protein